MVVSALLVFNLIIILIVSIMLIGFGLTTFRSGFHLTEHFVTPVLVLLFYFTAETAAEHILRKILLINDDCCWKYAQDQEEVYRDNNGSVDTKRLDSHYWTEDVCQEDSDTRNGCDCHCLKSPLESVAHAHMVITFVFLDAGTLPPSIHYNIDIVSCYSKHYENDQHMQVRKEGYSEHTLIY